MNPDRARWIRHPDVRNITVVALVAILLWAPRLRGMIDLRWDATVYYVLGTSLAEEKGYRLLSEPGEIHAIQYPPVLPAIVAAHQLVLGTDDPDVVGQALRYSYCGLFLAYAIAIYGLSRRHLDPRHALPVTLMSLCTLFSVFMSDLLFAEIPFAFATVIFALLDRRGGGRVRAVAASGMAIVAYLIRSTGIALLAAWVVEAAANRRWKQLALRGAIALVPVVAWQAYVGRVRSGEEYRHPAYPYQRAPYQYYNVSYAENLMLEDPFAPERGRLTPPALAGRFLRNTAMLPSFVGESVLGGRNARKMVAEQSFRIGLLPALASTIATKVLGVFSLAGLGVLLVRREWFLPAYSLFSLAIVCVTPWDSQFARYLTPLTPFLAISLALGLIAAARGVVRLAGGRWGRAMPAAALAALWLVVAKDAYSIQQTLRSWHDQRHTRPEAWDKHLVHLLYYDAGWAGFEESAAWIRAHARPEAVIASSTPQWIYLRTGRKAVMPPMEVDAARAQELLDSVPADYLIVDSLSHAEAARNYSGAVVEAYPDRWELMLRATYGDTRVYHRAGRPGAEGAESEGVPDGAGRRPR